MHVAQNTGFARHDKGPTPVTAKWASPGDMRLGRGQRDAVHRYEHSKLLRFEVAHSGAPLTGDGDELTSMNRDKRSHLGGTSPFGALAPS
jgi:hypothetical protein